MIQLMTRLMFYTVLILFLLFLFGQSFCLIHRLMTDLNIVSKELFISSLVIYSLTFNEVIANGLWIN